MARITRLMPFWIWPANWGLVGKRRQLAEAEYNFDGEDYDRRIAEINFDDPDSIEFLKEKLRLDKKYKKITVEEYEREINLLEYPDEDSVEHQMRDLEISLQFDLIDQNQFDKTSASLNGEPWFNVIGGQYASQGEDGQMTFELDWNDEFVQFLTDQGWTGVTDDQIVDSWFAEACRQMLMIDDDDIEQLEPASPAARTRKIRGDNGRSEYS